MPKTDPFLDSYNHIDKHQAEYALLLRLCYELRDTTFLLEIRDIQTIIRKYTEIIQFIKDIYKSYDLKVFRFDERGEASYEVLDHCAGMSIQEENLYNRGLKISNDNKSFVLIRSNTTYVLMKSGAIDEKFNNQYVSRKQLDAAENRKFGIDQLDEVFEHFHVNRKHQGCEYIINGKVSDTICEQQLRNHLYEYLNAETKLFVQVELCTSRTNDEESVDISLMDINNAVSIVEVKFFVKGRMFVTSQASKYSTQRFKDGYEQLNKYCEHLSENYTLHSAYLYMFYASDEKRDAIIKKDREIYDAFISSDDCNDKFRRYYKTTVYDDMVDSALPERLPV